MISETKPSRAKSSRQPALASLGPSGDAASPRRVCVNEGCTRLREPDEEYCSVCCLERNLFRRDERRREDALAAVRGAEARPR